MASTSRAIAMESKMKKLERKALRKQARKLFALKNQSNELEVSDKPTKHLIVSNGGLICGVDRNNLLAWFGKHGCIESLRMIPGKSFSIISFKTVEESAVAYKEIHGQSIHYPVLAEESQKQVTLYLAYLMDTSQILLGPSSANFRPALPSQSELHPPGLIVVQNFVSQKQEKDLINYFRIEDDVRNDDAKSSMKHRRVKHFGYEFIYGKNTVDKNNPLPEGIPEICNSIAEKMIEENVIDWKPNQLTVNQYDPGQGIPPHIDTHSAFTNGIISLSLGSQVVMEFCHPDGRQISLILPERSLLVMTGESRYLWTHGITPRKTDVVLETSDKSSDATNAGLTLKERGFRISLTFRKTLLEPCSCAYPEKCDSQGFKSPAKTKAPHRDEVAVPISELEARRLESKHVNNVYDHIADHFSDTRHSPWPRVAKFLQELPSESLVADVGCGNGKYLGVNKDIVTFGSDRSINLVKICRERGNCALVCDILALPYRSSAFDAAISIAVIHHLSTKERRSAAIRELARIVKPNGLILIHVWALEQNIVDEKGAKNDQLAAGEKSGKRGSKGAQNLGEEEAGRQASSKDAIGVESEPGTLENKVVEPPCSDESCQSIGTRGELTVSATNHTEKDTTTNKEIAVDTRVFVADSIENKKLTEESRTSILVNETRNVFKQQDLLVPWHFRGKKDKNCKKPSEIAADNGNKSKNGEVFHRYYHVFREGELEQLCREIGDVEIIDSYHDRGNWCVVLKKSSLH